MCARAARILKSPALCKHGDTLRNDADGEILAFGRDCCVRVRFLAPIKGNRNLKQSMKLVAVCVFS